MMMMIRTKHTYWTATELSSPCHTQGSSLDSLLRAGVHDAYGILTGRSHGELDHSAAFS